MMRGQGITSNSNRESIYVHGLKATNLRLDQHNVDSDVSHQSQISYVSQDNGTPSANYQGPERRHSENRQVRNGRPIGNLDLNATYKGNINDATQEMGAGLSLNVSKAGGAEVDSNAPPGTYSSNALLISSGISGYVLEENNDGQGISGGSRRLSCKRKAPEGSAVQLSVGGASSSTQQARNSDQQVIAQGNPSSSFHFRKLDAGLGVATGAPPSGNQTSSRVGSVLGARIGAATVNHQSSSAGANVHEGASVIHQNSNVAENGQGAGLRAASETNQASISVGEAENFQRNIRLRWNANQQSFAPSSLSTWNSHAQFLSETDMSFDSWNYLMVPRTASPHHATPELHPLVEVPELFHTQLYQGVPMLRVNGLSSSSAPINRGYIQNREENLRNNLRNIIHRSELERGNLYQGGTNLNFSSGNTNFPRNVASTSRNGNNSNVWLPSAPVWLTNPLMADLYFDRFAEYEGLLEFQGEGDYFQMQASTVASAREMENSVRDGNIRPPQRPPRSRLMPRADRQAVAHPDVPPAFRFLSPFQRRSTLVSGVHNALALVRRGGALRIEDLVVIDNSVFFGDSEDEEDDTHEDLRLDVDNMSYEELLVLEDQMGNVCTGLSEEAIRARMRLRRHQSINVGSPNNDEPCCICQEEYADGEDLGKLDCGHDFHANCIKKWLRLKNSCPICKLTALAGRKRDR